MKKFILALLATSSFISAAAFADPSIVTIVFTCPATTGTGPFVLNNFGTLVGGFGTETINGTPAFNSPFFRMTIPIGANIPSSLTTYSSSGTGFNNGTGQVSCSYTSTGTFDPITVDYQMLNCAGCQIASQTTSSITLNQFLGHA